MKKINNNQFYIIIGIGLLITSLSFLLDNFGFNFTFDILYIGLNVTSIASFFLLLANGTFIKSIFSNYIKIGISVLIIGALFKIMHWPYSNILISLAFVSFMIIYTAHFIQKPKLQLLDILKLMWVYSKSIVTILTFLHIISDIYSLISVLILFLAVIVFAYNDRKSNFSEK